MYRMIELNFPSGICHSLVRYALANNKLMGSLYNPTKLTFYIICVDANNIVGKAMSQPLPDDEYKLVSNDDCRDAFSKL